MNSKLKVLFVSPEVVPFAKSGGLADVSGSLPPALKRAGLDIRIVMPFYRSVKEDNFSLKTVVEGLPVSLGNDNIKARVHETRTFKNVPVYFLEREEFYDRPNLYGSYMGDYYDNFERFTFFSKGALELARAINFIPDIVHCHDWQTGIIPALLKVYYSGITQFSHTASVFTIHNMGYQGIFPGDKLSLTELTASDVFHSEGLEYWGKISLLKSGINYCDAVTTVSPTYAEEIQTPVFGMGMEGVLEKRSDALYGILNGIDYNVWNPEHDKHIAAPYNSRKLSGKLKCKEAVIGEMNIETSMINRPLIGIISRLDSQKGFDILLKAIDKIISLGTRIIILGSGDFQMEKALKEAAKKHKGKIGIGTGFNDPLAHRIMAGADILLIPSRYEPCGLTQMYAMKYGTVPVVRATGGLNDTVIDYDEEIGNGFKFNGFEPSSLLNAVRRAVNLFYDKPGWKKLILKGMKEDFSWKVPAEKYFNLYKTLIR